MTEWLDLSAPLTMADLENAQRDRCMDFLTGADPSLDAFASCYGPITGCGCDECAGSGQSGASVARVSSPSAAATPPAKNKKEEETMPAFTEEDELYEQYLRATGRDPDADPTLMNGTSAEPSDEVLQETIRRGEEATERLRQAGYPDDPNEEYRQFADLDEDQIYRLYLEQIGRDPRLDPTLRGKV